MLVMAVTGRRFQSVAARRALQNIDIPTLLRARTSPVSRRGASFPVGHGEITPGNGATRSAATPVQRSARFRSGKSTLPWSSRRSSRSGRRGRRPRAGCAAASRRSSIGRQGPRRRDQESGIPGRLDVDASRRWPRTLRRCPCSDLATFAARARARAPPPGAHFGVHHVPGDQDAARCDSRPETDRGGPQADQPRKWLDLYRYDGTSRPQFRACDVSHTPADCILR